MNKLFSLALFIALLAACKKDTPPPPDPPCTENGLPCLTTEGKNMFACLIDGEPWIAQAPFSFGGPIPLYGEYNPQDGSLTLQATREIDDQNVLEGIYVIGKNIFGLKNDSIRSNNPTPYGFINYEQSDCSEYFHDTLKKGVLNILYYDTVNYIISGTFSMDLFNSDCVDSVMHITQGRFDLKYSN